MADKPRASKRLTGVDIDCLCTEIAHYLHNRGTAVTSWAERVFGGSERTGYLVPNATSPGDALKLENEPVTPAMVQILLSSPEQREAISIGAVMRLVAHWRLHTGLLAWLPIPRSVFIEYRNGCAVMRSRYVPGGNLVIASAI